MSTKVSNFHHEGRGAARGAKSSMPMDIHVGLQVRRRRLEVGIGVEQFAGLMGVSRQQIEKWEKGHSRLSASRIYEISQVLYIDPGWFFKGFVGGEVNDNSQSAVDGLMTKPVLEFVALLQAIQPHYQHTLKMVMHAFGALSRTEGVEDE